MNFIILIVPVILIAYLMYRFRSLPIYLKGLKTYNNGNTDKAMELLKRSIEEGLAEKHQLTVGYLLLKEGNPDDAERIFNFLIENPGAKFNADHARCYNALIHWKKGRLHDAVEELEELLKDGYRTTALYSNLGFFLILLDKLDRALEVNEEAWNYDEKSPVIQDNLGLCHIKRLEWTKAEQIYKKLLEQEPGFPDAWYNAALVAIHSNDNKKAASLLETALEKKFSYLSTLKREQVEDKLRELKESED